MDQTLDIILHDLVSGIEIGDENVIQDSQNQLKLIYEESITNQDLIYQTIQKIVKLDSWKFRKHAQKLISACVESVFGNDINIISDFYLRLSLELGHSGYFNEAIETAGKNLLLQMENNGVLNDKTAESHFILGSFFIRKELFDNARKELLTSRAIYQRIHGESSILVANCDFTIGHVETLDLNYSGAFLSFYKCYSTRKAILGKGHNLTKAAENQLNMLRVSTDSVFTSALELKHRISQLQWNTFPQKSYQYVISFFISRLGDDVVMNQEQLHAIVTSAIKFYGQTFGQLEMIDITDLSTKVCNILSNRVEEIASIIHSANDIPLHLKKTTPESPTPFSPNKSPPKKNNLEVRSAKNVQLSVKTETDPTIISSPNMRSGWSMEKTPEPKSLIRPKTWKVIPPHSPLRTGIDYDTQMRTIFASINDNPCHTHFLHDNSGSLFCVKKCSADYLLEILKPKLIAFALLAWYSKNTLKLKPTSRKLSVLKVVASGGPSSTSTDSDPKAALNALFMKRLPPGMAGPALNGDSNTASTSTSTKGKFAETIPKPPPLPSSWPPIPFSKEEIIAGEPAASQEVIASKPKMKLIHLSGLENVEKTFWTEQFDAFIPVEELFNDLEEEFLIGLKKKAPGNSSANKPAAKPAVSKQAMEGVLDPQRSQNISIMLAKFGKKNLDDIANIVECFDAKGLGTSAVSALLQFIPTIDEASKVCNFVNSKLKGSSSGSDPSVDPVPIDCKVLTNLKIGKPEQFIYLFSKVRKLEKKLNAISTLLSAPEFSDNIVSNSETLSNAVAEVKGCGRLKFILRTIVDLNNFLLKQAKSGNPIAGTPIVSWKKLAQVKLNSGETAQQYIVKKLLQHVPESLELQSDMPSIDEAKSVLIPRLNADLKKLQECLVTIEELLKDENDENSKQQEKDINNLTSKTIKNLSEFQQELKKIYIRAEESFKAGTEEFASVCNYFGETVPPATPETFFGELSQLCKSLQNITVACGGKQRKKA